MKKLGLTIILFVLFSGMANAQDDAVPCGTVRERQVRLIVLADPFSDEHWMPVKRRGLSRNYTAQDIIEMIEELKPDCLERFITGYQNPYDLVPVRKGCPQMTVLEFLNAAILAGGEKCHIVPKLNLQWLRSERGAAYFWKSAQALYDMPLVRPIRNINLDVWDHYCQEIHTTQEERDAMFRRLREIGYEEIGVNMTGLYRVNHPEIDYADFNINKETWQVNEQAVRTLRSYPNIKRLYMYIDYPGPMNAFRLNTPDRQAEIYTENIFPMQEELGFTFVYAVIQDSWDAHESVTSAEGPYKGKTLYEITKELLDR